MKILKHGNVRMVKLTCPRCGCVFLCGIGGNGYTTFSGGPSEAVRCPQEGCRYWFMAGEGQGEVPEEPSVCPDRERLELLLREAMRGKGGRNSLSPGYLADRLIAGGVIFRDPALRET